jgi:hypothetical protein
LFHATFQCRLGIHPPFWALGCSPMQEHIDKLGFMVLYASYSESEYNSCYKPKNKCPGNNAFIPVI